MKLTIKKVAKPELGKVRGSSPAAEASQQWAVRAGGCGCRHGTRHSSPHRFVHGHRSHSNHASFSRFQTPVASLHVLLALRVAGDLDDRGSGTLLPGAGGR